MPQNGCLCLCLPNPLFAHRIENFHSCCTHQSWVSSKHSAILDVIQSTVQWRFQNSSQGLFWYWDDYNQDVKCGGGVEDIQPMTDICALLRRAGIRDLSRKPFLPLTINHVRPRSSSSQRLDRPFKQIEPAQPNDSIFFYVYRKLWGRNWDSFLVPIPFQPMKPYRCDTGEQVRLDVGLAVEDYKWQYQ